MHTFMRTFMHTYVRAHHTSTHASVHSCIHASLNPRIRASNACAHASQLERKRLPKERDDEVDALEKDPPAGGSRRSSRIGVARPALYDFDLEHLEPDSRACNLLDCILQKIAETF